MLQLQDWLLPKAVNQSDRLEAINRYNRSLDGGDALQTIGLILAAMVAGFFVLKLISWLTSGSSKRRKSSRKKAAGKAKK